MKGSGDGEMVGDVHVFWFSILPQFRAGRYGGRGPEPCSGIMFRRTRARLISRTSASGKGPIKLRLSVVSPVYANPTKGRRSRRPTHMVRPPSRSNRTPARIIFVMGRSPEE